MNSQFELPPKSGYILAHTVGLVTAIVAIASLGYRFDHLSKTVLEPNSQASAMSIPATLSPEPIGDSIEINRSPINFRSFVPPIKKLGTIKLSTKKDYL
jgi:hypothetical protein